MNSRTQSLDDKTPQQLNSGFLLCAEHFEHSQFMDIKKKSSLIHCTVPTIFQVPRPPDLLMTKRPAPTARLNTAASAKRHCLTSVVNNSGVFGQVTTSSIPSSAHAPTVLSTAAATPRKAELQSKLLYARKCLSSARVSLFCRKRISNDSSPYAKRHCSGVCEQINSLPAATRSFVHSQINAASVCRLGMRWSQQEKLLALGLFYKSPYAYRFMQHSFRLPTERTLRTYISGFDVTTGFDCDYMLSLQQRAESLNGAEKCVVVTFDGMSLKSSLKYLEHDDRVVGFEDLSAFGGVSVNAAQQALQFMVRGVSSKWKQPVGHFFLGRSLSACVLKAVILKLVEKLESFGFIVCAIVCDQEPTHRTCLTSLGVSTDKPSFTSFGGNVVHVLHDPPHLLKNVRNNLLKYDFLIDNDVISFDHVVALYDLEQCNVLRFVPKLQKITLN